MSEADSRDTVKVAAPFPAASEIEVVFRASDSWGSNARTAASAIAMAPVTALLIRDSMAAASAIRPEKLERFSPSNVTVDAVSRLSRPPPP